ncbi:MAG: DNA recombination protein RmuC [Candidatus Omnitrophica bacterium]|nr:DNA recombination protein RmuC [Candidatus Omnitrophota bacterium]
MLWLTGVLFLLLSLAVIGIVLKISSQVNERLNQMNQSLQEANKIIGQNLSGATTVFGSVKEQLGKLESTNAQILEVSKNISSLQELLRAPKFRGQMGETLLENLLAQILPKDYFSVQYRFKSSDTVDAVIRLGDHLVPIDAKFSLENFQKMLEAQDEAQKSFFRKKFTQDLKNRIDEITARYILPQENTFDFAFMYIPAENVYYELIIKEDALSYALSKRVIPVSPNTLYAYLQVVCLGLKGLKVEENAKGILKGLSALSVDITKFKDDFNTLGSHLSNAKTKYDDSTKRLERFSERLENIEDNKKIDLK